MVATPTDPGARRAPFFALGAASLVPGAMDVTRSFGQGRPIDLASVVLTTVSAVVLLTALAATFDRAMKRQMTVVRSFLLTAGVAIGVSVAETFAAAAIAGALHLEVVPSEHRAASVVLRMGVASGVAGLGLFAIAVALPFAVSGAREAERLRAAAELSRLRANLQPHFLFNTLSTVSGLVDEDPREARRLVGALADLLRDSLVESDDMRTLGDEIEWLRHYATILETRHRGFISFTWDIDEATRDIRVPRLLLQPLVENAVRHGALRRPEGGEVAVRTTLSKGPGARVTCIVEDNGPGPQPGARRPGAMGLDLVTRRLALRYGKWAEFRLESEGGRTRSIVALPAELSS
jgi:two-component sensor histidine kinase